MINEQEKQQFRKWLKNAIGLDNDDRIDLIVKHVDHYFSGTEDKNHFAISFACWALYDPQAQSYLSAGITALGLLEKYLDRPYISTNTNQQ